VIERVKISVAELAHNRRAEKAARAGHDHPH
jgi:hypothetical protein